MIMLLHLLVVFALLSFLFRQKKSFAPLTTELCFPCLDLEV